MPPKEYEGSSVQRGRIEWTEEAALRQMTQNRNLQPAPVRKAPRSTNAILALLGMPDSEPSAPSTMDQQMPPKGSCQADRAQHTKIPTAATLVRNEAEKINYEEREYRALKTSHENTSHMLGASN